MRLPTYSASATIKIGVNEHHAPNDTPLATGYLNSIWSRPMQNSDLHQDGIACNPLVKSLQQKASSQPRYYWTQIVNSTNSIILLIVCCVMLSTNLAGVLSWNIPNIIGCCFQFAFFLLMGILPYCAAFHRSACVLKVLAYLFLIISAFGVLWNRHQRHCCNQYGRMEP